MAKNTLIVKTGNKYYSSHREAIKEELRDFCKPITHDQVFMDDVAANYAEYWHDYLKSLQPTWKHERTVWKRKTDTPDEPTPSPNNS